MIKVYHPYYNWECFINGMYSQDSTGTIDQAVLILSDPVLFDKVLGDVIKKWPISAEEHLTNTGSNRRSWCGQAACCYLYRVNEQTTRLAWARLDNKQQYTANQIATRHIKQYERNYTKLHKEMGIKMLF